ncbi:MAG TPA: TOBE domain-containing protein, partial [Devosia sp.]|nr:TOBE domain-containing protein [Devosia sp.]
AALRTEMRIELMRLHKDLGATMIYVTHDQVEAMTLADKIVVLNAGEISQVGTPLELYNTPANRFVASFIGSPSMNFLPVTAESADGLNVHLNLAGSGGVAVKTRTPLNGAAKTDKLEMGLRPEHVQVTTPDDPAANIKGSVSIVEQLGNSTIFYVETPAGQFVVEEDGAKSAKSGDNVGLILDPNNVHVFGANGLTV